MKVGILVIGSLLWDDNEIRKEWRKCRLSVETKIEVQAPIRYGRKSEQRGETHTMVLSKTAGKGRAFVLPCLKSVHTFDELLEEAIFLWRAEDKKREGTNVSKFWGCTALMVRNQDDCPQEILQRWAELAASKHQDFKIKHAHNEDPLVSTSGLLDLTWPLKVNDEPLSEVDLLLATTNQPSLNNKNEYDGPDDIGKAWLRAPLFDHYFYKNREHGIKTFQDEEILEEFWRACTGSC